MKMNKLTILSLVFILVLSFNVFAVGNVAFVDNIIPNPSSVIPGQSVSIPVNITNNGDDTLGSITFSLTSTTIVSNFAVSGDVLNILQGQNRTVTLSFVVPATAVPEFYPIRVRAVARDTSNNQLNSVDSNQFTIQVNPVPVNPSVQLKDSSNNQLSQIDLNAAPGETITKTVTITNNGNVGLTNVNLAYTFPDLTDSDDHTATFTLSTTTLGSLAIGASTTFTITARTPSGFDIGSISQGTLRLSSSEKTDLSTISVNWDVEPNSCPTGASSGSLDVTIDYPDDDSDYSSQDQFTVKVIVDNNYNNDKRVRTVLSVYNLDSNKKLLTQTQEERVNDDSTQEFDFDVDLSQYDVEDGDQLGIFVKSFERGNEVGACVAENINVNVEVPAHNVLLNSLSLNPTTANCGDIVSVSGILNNAGSNSERVRINVKNPNLGLSYYTNEYLLGTTLENNEQSVSFTFNIPQNAQPGNYLLDVLTLYGTTTTSTQKTLTVTCGTQQQINQNVVNQPVAGTTQNIPTGYVVSQGFFDNFDTSDIPTSVWILINTLIVVLIILALVFLFRKGH